MTTKLELRQARFEQAQWWLDCGVELVPLKPRSKELQPGYGLRQAHIADIPTASRWFLNTDANLGVVLEESTGLVVCDWDDTTAYALWHLGAGAQMVTRTEQTARGYHVFFFGTGLVSATNQGCELKTRGICMVSPSLHPTGVIYRVIIDSPISHLDGAATPALFPFLSVVKCLPVCDANEARSSRNLPGASHHQAPIGTGVVMRIKAARTIVDEMSTAGLKLRPIGKTTLIGLCPFHNDHSPSLWVNSESGLWGCNRPDCLAAGTHDVINFRALRMRISNETAIQQLADEFL